MKLIHENRLIVLKRHSWLVLILLLSATTGSAQDSTLTDTNGSTAHDESTATTDPSDTGDRKTGYFDEIIHDRLEDTVQLRAVPGYSIDSLRKDDAFWYANKGIKRNKTRQRERGDIKLPSQWMNMTTLVIIVVLFIGMLAWYLFRNNIIRRKQSIILKKAAEDISEENIFYINYQKEIEKAIGLSNYRLAIRLLFLRLLKDLSQRNIIQYKQDRTNFDYLSQLSKSRHYNDFFRLARNYEYAWYGKFDVNPEVFGVIKKDFENFDLKLS